MSQFATNGSSGIYKNNSCGLSLAALRYIRYLPIVKLWPRHVCTVVISYVSTNVCTYLKLRYLTQAITSDHIMNDLDIICTDTSCVDDGILEELKATSIRDRHGFLCCTDK